MKRAAAIIVLVGAALMAMPATARDDGRYAGSKLKPWFNELRDKNGQQCCADADGATVKDVDWTTVDVQRCRRTLALSFVTMEAGEYAGTYCVRYKGEWWLVPTSATLDQPNKFGPAIIWPVCSSKEHVSGADACKDEESKLLFIRCFIPSAMS